MSNPRAASFRERLTWRPPRDDINFYRIEDTGDLLYPALVGKVPIYCHSGEVMRVSLARLIIEICPEHYPHSGLLEAGTEPARASEQIGSKSYPRLLRPDAGTQIGERSSVNGVIRVRRKRHQRASNKLHCGRSICHQVDLLPLGYGRETPNSP
jgi:hypothetical protein